MQPTPSDVHVNRPLTDISIAWMQDQNEFIADRVAPIVPVKKQSDKIFELEKGQWFRPKAQKRAPGAEAVSTGYTINSTLTYFCDVWALKHAVDDDTRANYDEPLDPDREATELVTRDMTLTREVQWASAQFTTGVWHGGTSNTDVTPSILWSSPGSTPIADIRTEARMVKKYTGFRANKFVTGDYTMDVLLDHPDLLERIKYTQTAIVTAQLLASVLGFDDVLVGGAVINTANEGQATDSLDFLFGKNALVCYTPARPGLMRPSCAYTFMWTSRVGGFQRVLRYRWEIVHSDFVEAECAFNQKVISSYLGSFFSGCVA